MRAHRYSAAELTRLASRLRLLDLETIYNAGAGHLGGEMSAMDILTVLYFDILNYNTDNPKDPHRDRFVLSKGHIAAALYVVLAEAGFIRKEDLATFQQPNSKLNGHPDCTKVSGVETNTGPLGHGLPVAVGMAIAAKHSGASWQTFALVGDGELQEGSNWEAAMIAAQHQLDNLTLIIDRNRLQQGARTEATSSLEPLASKWQAFGWEVQETDGHDIEGLRSCLRGFTADGKPHCLIAHTNKGQGISFASDRVEWHHKLPNAAQYEQARAAFAERIGENA